MKPRITCRCFSTTFIILSFISSFWSSNASAQKQISQRDKRNIEAAAKETLEKYRILLNTIADQTVTPAERSEVIDNSFDVTTIFYNEFELENDTDPTVHNSSSSSTIKIKSYLNELQYNFLPDKKGEAVIFDHITFSNIYVGQKHLYIKVSFVKYYNGKHPQAGKYTANNRTVEMQIIPADNDWKLYINDIYFTDRKSTTSSPYVKIVDDKSIATANDDSYTDEYCRFILTEGTKALRENNFAVAHYSFMEATKRAATRSTAEKQLEELKRVVSGANLIYGEHVFDELVKEARELEKAYMFEEAKKYYIYALETNPKRNENIPAVISLLNEKLAKDSYIEELYNKGLYKQAIKEYTYAINSNKLNSNLYVGLAKSQWKAGLAEDAKSSFAVAIKVNPDNAEIFRWQAYFNKDIGQYEDAYKSYVSYVNKLNKDNPLVKTTYSEMAICKGLILYEKNRIEEAIDTFEHAAQLDPTNVEPFLHMGKCYARIKKYAEAGSAINRALAIDPQNAEVYFMKGEIEKNNITDTRDDPRARALMYYKQAIGLNNKVPEWHFKLGELYLSLADIDKENSVHARESFTNCIKIDTSANSVWILKSHWKRAVCYYYIRDFSAAKQDFDVCLPFYGKKVQAFCVDYGNYHLRQQNYDSAIVYFKRAPNAAAAYFGLGIATYKSRGESNKEIYIQYFKDACLRGIKRSQFEEEPMLSTLQDDRDFKKFLKSCE